MFDLLVKNGSVLDGSGTQAFPADVGIRNGCIQAISTHIEGHSKEIVDANNCTVCPGFIDMHSHSDFTLLKYPQAESKISQGITTEVVGNCGVSPAPVSRANYQYLVQHLLSL